MKYLFILISLTLLISCNESLVKNENTSADDEVLATWRGGQITLKEYEEFALYYAFHEDLKTAQTSTYDKRREILRDMMNFKLIELLADSMKLDTMKVMKESYKRKLGGVSYQHHLFPDSVRRKAFSDEMVKEFYNKMKYQYDIKHILLLSNETNDTKVKLKIDSIHANILKYPDSFSDVAEKYSEDKASAVKGGNLGWSLTPNFVPEFEAQILKLKEGDISNPFKTQFGWHIATVIGKKENNSLGPIDKEFNKISNYLTKKYQDKYDKAFTDFKEFLYTKYGVVVNYEEIAKFVSRFNVMLANKQSVDDSFKYYDRSIALALFENDSLNVENALNNLSKMDREKYPNIEDKIIYDMIFNTFQRKLITLASEELGYTKRPEVIKIAKEGMIIDHLEYFTDRFLANKEEGEKWYKNFYRVYNLHINYTNIEKSFIFSPADDKK